LHDGLAASGLSPTGVLGIIQKEIVKASGVPVIGTVPTPV
jgi:hypothetical protein